MNLEQLSPSKVNDHRQLLGSLAAEILGAQQESQRLGAGLLCHSSGLIMKIRLSVVWLSL